MVIRLTKGRLKVAIAENRAELGEVAAREVAAYIMALQKEKPEVNIIFASAPSQNEFLANLLHYDIDWGRINAFHMDEYIGIDPHAPQSFGQFLRDRIFSKRNFKSVNYINPQVADPEAECARYAALLRQMPADMVFLGIGENGHLAFNDPHVAFFNDPLTVKTVDLDPTCIRQQVNDGCFSSIDQVPTRAYTITKANAIKGTCDGPIVSSCPASIQRTHRDCTLYVDRDSASLVSR